MPYLFVTDNAPEAEDYASNYIWYDANDPESVREALAEVTRRRGESVQLVESLSTCGTRRALRIQLRGTR